MSAAITIGMLLFMLLILYIVNGKLDSLRASNAMMAAILQLRITGQLDRIEKLSKERK
jgi:hypothetical protein